MKKLFKFLMRFLFGPSDATVRSLLALDPYAFTAKEMAVVFNMPVWWSKCLCDRAVKEGSFRRVGYELYGLNTKENR